MPSIKKYITSRLKLKDYKKFVSYLTKFHRC